MANAIRSDPDPDLGPRPLLRHGDTGAGAVNYQLQTVMSVSVTVLARDYVHYSQLPAYHSTPAYLCQCHTAESPHGSSVNQALINIPRDAQRAATIQKSRTALHV